MNSHEILGPNGSISRRLKNYEAREPQLEMADAVAKAIEAKNHLVVEAGTGVGKSFGYLVPAILSLQNSQKDEKAPRRRIVVSTHTISLQEQLVNKDIPLLNSVIPLEFSAVLAKGRGNYLSLRRLGKAIEKSDSLFDTDEQLNQLRQVSSWSRTTTDGSLADLPEKVYREVWDEARSDGGNCMGRKCPTYEQCFYYKARKRLQNADVMIVNHALFFSDLGLRRMGINLLPDYDVVILDEAHTVEDVASDHLGLSITKGQIEYTLNKLYNQNTNKGLFVFHKLAMGQKSVVACRNESEHFFSDILGWVARKDPDGRSSSTRVRDAGIVQNNLSPRLSKLSQLAKQFAENTNNESEKKDLVSASERLDDLAAGLETWRLQSLEDNVHWIESSTNRWGNVRISLMAAPIDIGPVLRKELFDKTDTCILTSATLAVGNQSFDFFRNRVGLTQSATKQLGSPFDFEKQAKLVLVTNLACPSANRDLHERQSIDAIRHYIEQTDGHAFVLFTSYHFMNRAIKGLTSWMSSQNLAIYQQGSGVSRTQLLDRFKSNPRGVLFGTDSFWQGVDVQGDALQNVIIPKFPFSVPDQPLLQARLDAIRQSGGKPFFDYQLPEAVIKFKQGFGRLIRSRSDTGMVVVLDPRVRTKQYGHVFVESLPKCNVVYETI
ncbi:MAG: helicase C-terminal domain-containing protein [Planctomycetota bacterium]